MYNYSNIREELRAAKNAPQIKLNPQPAVPHLHHVNNYIRVHLLHAHTHMQNEMIHRKYQNINNDYLQTMKTR